MTAPPLPAPPRGAAFLLGVALGGFFDGILLHQVLQWHHLLSNVQAVQELRWQLLADGLFHALMYVLAVAALWRLWRRRAQAGPASWLLAVVLAGFAAWHGLDALLSHWVLGIHRVRVDVPDPLFWDLLWLALFGAIPLVVAAWLRRRSVGRGPAAVAGLAVLALSAGWLSLNAGAPLPGSAVVVFAPGVPPARAFEALARLDAQVRWVDPAGAVWAVEWGREPAAWELLRHGAVLAGGTALALGCTASTRIAS